MKSYKFWAFVKFPIVSDLCTVKNIDDDFEKPPVHSIDHSSNRYFIKFLLCASPRDLGKHKVPAVKKLKVSPQAAMCRSLCGERGRTHRARDGGFRFFISTVRTERSHKERCDDRFSTASPLPPPSPC